MVKEIRISMEAHILLQKARLPSEEINDTILRLIELRERDEFFKRQKTTTEDENFLPLDEPKE